MAWTHFSLREAHIKAFRRHWDLSRATRKLAGCIGVPLPIHTHTHTHTHTLQVVLVCPSPSGQGLP